MEARMCWEFSHGLADIGNLSRARSEGYNLLISANPCENSKHILASMIYFLIRQKLWSCTNLRHIFINFLKSPTEVCFQEISWQPWLLHTLYSENTICDDIPDEFKIPFQYWTFQITDQMMKQKTKQMKK